MPMSRRCGRSSRDTQTIDAAPAFSRLSQDAGRALKDTDPRDSMPALHMNILRLLLLLALLPFIAACGEGAPGTASGFVGASDARSIESTPAPASNDYVTVAELPPEGRATLALIKQNGPFPYSRDGTLFGNREGLLPKQSRGYYREYTVPTPGLNHRGARRIVSGGRGGEYWYTADHYRSFKRIRE